MLTVSTKDLGRALSSAVSALNPRTPMPVMQSVEFSVNGVVSVRGSSPQISVIQNLEAKQKANCRFSVEGKAIYDIIKSLPEGDVTLRPDEQRLFLESSIGRYTLPVSYDRAPELSGGDKTGEILFKHLQSIVDLCLFACMVGDTLPAMQGALFEFKGEEGLRVVTTDGKRCVQLIFEEYKLEHAPIIIPSKTLHLAAKTFGSTPVAMRVSDKSVEFAGPNGKITSTIIDESFPNFGAIVPTTTDKELVISSKVLLASVKRAQLFTGSTSKLVIFRIQDNKLSVHSGTSDGLSNAEETLSCSYKCANPEEQKTPFEIGFNGLFVEEQLSHLEFDEVRLRFIAPNRAVIVETVGRNTAYRYQGILMPLRIQKENGG